MTERDRTIIDAVLRRAEKVCPGSLELLGVYGSAATGDTHAHSDLDLLIVAGNGDAGKLAEGFILDDTGVGYDLYCTGWDMLENDAQCPHARLSKLFDSKIVFCRDDGAMRRLEDLRERAAAVLASDERYEKAKNAFGEAEKAFAEAHFTDSLSRVGTQAGLAVSWLLDAVMLYHGRYFKKGVKRTFEELGELDLPFDIEAAVMNVIRARTPEEIRSELAVLFRAARGVMRPVGMKEEPSPDNVAGTYEEMVSNWRNKTAEVAERGDCFSSFMALGSLQMMMDEIAEGVETGDIAFMDRFDPDDLSRNEALFDEALRSYLAVYEKAGIRPKRYADAQAFAAEYPNRNDS